MRKKCVTRTEPKIPSIKKYMTQGNITLYELCPYVPVFYYFDETEGVSRYKK